MGAKLDADCHAVSGGDLLVAKGVEGGESPPDDVEVRSEAAFFKIPVGVEAAVGVPLEGVGLDFGLDWGPCFRVAHKLNIVEGTPSNPDLWTSIIDQYSFSQFNILYRLMAIIQITAR